MEKVQADTNKYILYSPDSLKYITDNMFTILDKKMEEFMQLFGISEYRKIEIFFFDDIERFREYVYNLRGEKDSLPDYAAGVYDDGKIIAYIPTGLKTDSIEYYTKLYFAPHELFHIMYLELALKGDYSKRIIWYDEGMAQLSSGEYSGFKDEEDFKNFFESIKAKTKRLPNLNELSHGDSFCNDDYDGYSLSYLAARYLKEKLSTEEFKALLWNPNKVFEYGESVLEEMMDYYTREFTSKSIS